MDQRMTATEIKTKLAAVLDAVANGEEIEITRRGHLVARLEPVKRPLALKNRFAGVVVSAASDEELFTTDWKLSS